MFQSFGVPEMLILVLIILLLFGVGRVPRLGKELGSAISAFRKGLSEGKETDQASESDTSEKV